MKEADAIFSNPKLAAIYDHFDGQREDLVAYIQMAQELQAKSILDIGCGTGCFPLLASAQGFQVIGLDPAQASIEIAQIKSGAEKIQWLIGDTSSLPSCKVDLAVMTGNVAQVFVEDREWEKTLSDIRSCLVPNGHLAFEVRDPAKKAWLDWTPEKTRQTLEIPDWGLVEGSCQLINVQDELVHFRWTYLFHDSGDSISSDSVLRFRSRSAIEHSLKKCGYTVHEIRDAPDRPGKEFVFIAKLAD